MKSLFCFACFAAGRGQEQFSLEHPVEAGNVEQCGNATPSRYVSCSTRPKEDAYQHAPDRCPRTEASNLFANNCHQQHQSVQFVVPSSLVCLSGASVHTHVTMAILRASRGCLTMNCIDMFAAALFCGP